MLLLHCMFDCIISTLSLPVVFAERLSNGVVSVSKKVQKRFLLSHYLVFCQEGVMLPEWRQLCLCIFQ